MAKKKDAPTGMARLAVLSKEDSLIRSMMELLEEIRIDCEGAAHFTDELEETLKRFLEHVDATPPELLSRRN